MVISLKDLLIIFSVYSKVRTDDNLFGYFHFYNLNIIRVCGKDRLISLDVFIENKKSPKINHLCLKKVVINIIKKWSYSIFVHIVMMFFIGYKRAQIKTFGDKNYIVH